MLTMTLLFLAIMQSQTAAHAYRFSLIAQLNRSTAGRYSLTSCLSGDLSHTTYMDLPPLAIVWNTHSSRPLCCGAPTMLVRIRANCMVVTVQDLDFLQPDSDLDKDQAA